MKLTAEEYDNIYNQLQKEFDKVKKTFFKN